MNKRIFIYSFLFISVIAQSQEFPDKLADSLQDVLDNAVMDYDLKGVSGSVILGDNSQWTGTSGIASEGVSIDTSRLFLFASLTKTFVAATILQLYEEEKLSLGDSIGSYIGPFNHIDGSEPIRDLLNMSTGFYDFTDTSTFWPTMIGYPDSVFSTQQVLDTYISDPEPNEENRLIYRNTNFLLLGLVIESVTGNTFGEEIDNRFFKPLHLNNTFFVPVGLQEDDINGGWGDVGAGFQYVGDRSPNSVLTAYGSAGGLVSTPQEMARWIKALNEGEFLNQSSLDSMRTLLDGNKYASGYFLGQGLGTQANRFDGYTLYGHKGFLVHHSLTLYSIDKQLAISYVINHESQTSLDKTFHELFKEVIGFEVTSDSEQHRDYQIVFPNPAKDNIQISHSGFDHNKPFSISIIDYQGRTVLHTISHDNPAEFSVDISQCKPGIYLVLLQQDQKQFSAQLIKE